MEREVLRHLLFAHLKQYPSTQLTTIYAGVATLAVNGDYVPKPDNFVPSNGFLNVELLPESDRLVLQELTWDLVLQGVLTPGSNWSNSNLPFVRLTEYGKRCVQEESILPHDYGMYLEEIKRVSAQTDSIFLVYLTESIEAFNKALYISSVVNLGIASERLTLILIEAYADAIENQANKTRFQAGINRQRHIAYKFEELFKHLTSNREKFPDEIRDNLDMIRYLEEMLRKERNDAGHPTGKSFSREEALVLLLAFPTHYKTVVKLNDWLRANPSSI